MKPYEPSLDRLKGLGKWFSDILPDKAKALLTTNASMA